MTFFRETKQDLGHYNKIRHITRGSITNGQIWHKSARKYFGMYNAKTLYIPKIIIDKSCSELSRVSVQGVESLWGDCRFIPADWGS